MSWITRTRQQLTGFMSRRETPDNLWTKCRSCGTMVYTKEWEENQSVCPRCDHHERIGPKARFAQIFDGDFTAIAVPKVAEDPLKFRDQKRYVDRLRAAKAATGEPEAMTVGDGSIDGVRAIVAIRTSPSWAVRWAWASAKPFLPAPARPWRRRCPSSSSQRQAARGCRRVFSA